MDLDEIDELMLKISLKDLPSKRSERFEALLDRFKKMDSPYAEAVKTLESISIKNQLQLFYVGGFLRDLWLGLKNPRDIDIVYNDVDEKRFSDLLRPAYKTRFGGYRFNLKGVQVDAWRIGGTFHFAKGLVLPTSINNFPETVFFTLESIVLETVGFDGRRWGWEKGFFKACEEREIEIQNPFNAFPDLQIARTYHLHKKLGWNIGPLLKSYLSLEISKISPQKVNQAYQSHYHISPGQNIVDYLKNLD